jgi:hypothetical protein
VTTLVGPQSDGVRTAPQSLYCSFGLTYGRPEVSIVAVPGAPAIKSATLSVTVDYETS